MKTELKERIVQEVIQMNLFEEEINLDGVLDGFLKGIPFFSQMEKNDLTVSLRREIVDVIADTLLDELTVKLAIQETRCNECDRDACTCQFANYIEGIIDLEKQGLDIDKIFKEE